MLFHCYSLGEIAYYDGVPLSNCPYPDGSVGAESWKEGWLHAKSEEFAPVVVD